VDVLDVGLANINDGSLSFVDFVQYYSLKRNSRKKEQQERVNGLVIIINPIREHMMAHDAYHAWVVVVHQYPV